MDVRPVRREGSEALAGQTGHAVAGPVGRGTRRGRAEGVGPRPVSSRRYGFRQYVERNHRSLYGRLAMTVRETAPRNRSYSRPVTLSTQESVNAFRPWTTSA